MVVVVKVKGRGCSPAAKSRRLQGRGSRTANPARLAAHDHDPAAAQAAAAAPRAAPACPALQAPGVEPARLTVSLAESLCLRASIKPLTFPFKIWASYKLVLFGKRLQLGGRPTHQRQQAAEAASSPKRRSKLAGT